MGKAANRMVEAECDAGSVRWDQAEQRQACLTVPKTLGPSVARMARVVSSPRARLSLVLPGFELRLADA